MKKKNLLIILSFVISASIASAGDLTPSTIQNYVWESSPSHVENPKKIRLFGKKNKKNVTPSSKDNLTDEEYIKKLRKSDKLFRKESFEINVTEHKSDDGYYGGGEDVSPDPGNKKFLKKFRKSKKVTKKDVNPESNKSSILLTSDVSDYYPERTEIEARGNAKLEIKGEDFTLYADKIIFNHEVNSVRAYDNVKIIKAGTVTTGDFINIDLNTAHGWVEKPYISDYSVKIRADEAYIYPDKIEEYDGVMNIAEDRRFMLGSSNFTDMLNPGQIDFGKMFKPDAEPGVLTIKAKHIDVDSKEGHNDIILRNASVYYKKFKIATVPYFKIAADKENTSFETNIPEFGNMSNMGMYAGPAVLLDLPFSTVLKLAPIGIYSQDKSKFGIGGIATIHNETNYTEMAYGSAEDKFLLRGSQKITDHLDFRYSQNMYTSQWFMGFRRPVYSLELVYDDSAIIEDLGVKFRHQLQAGYYSDYQRMSQGEGRLRWMTQTQKPVFWYKNPSNTFNAEVGIIGQTSIAQYTNGDTFALGRIGPIISTSFKNWNQSIVYYQTAVGGKTPFAFDDYYYGKSNLQIVETLKLHKYLSIGYLASMALTGRNSYMDPTTQHIQNNKTNDFLQENMFLVSIGPEAARFTIGYDAFRQATALYFSMLLGTKDMNIEFDKVSVNNPENIGNENKRIKGLREKFNAIRYKVFPATDPNYDPKKLIIPVNSKVNETDDEDVIFDEETGAELKRQLEPYLLSPGSAERDRIPGQNGYNF